LITLIINARSSRKPKTNSSTPCAQNAFPRS